MAQLVAGGSEVFIGRSIDELETPALLLDLDAFERNSAKISGFLRERGVDWRPHAKGHKSPDIARRQIALGAIGATVAKVGEAEVMADGGIERILVVTEQPLASKWSRVARLQRTSEVIVAVDHPDHIELASSAALSEGVVIPVVIELDIGMARSGVQPGKPALELGRAIERVPGLELQGVFAYEGHLLRTWPAEEKERVIREAIGRLVETRAEFEREGLPSELATCGGTGSYRVTATIPGVTEIQAGGGCFMDQMYALDCHVEGLEFALTVRTSVASTPTRDRAVTDAGWKTMSVDRGKPVPIGRPGVTIRYLSAEHGVLDIGPGAAPLRIGDRVDFIVGYHDSTVVLHDQILGVRGGEVEAVFPTLARGRLT